MFVNLWLVVEPTHLKNMLVKLGSFPQIVMNFKCLKPRPRSVICSRVILNTWQLFFTHGINLFNGFLQNIAPTFSPFRVTPDWSPNFEWIHLQKVVVLTDRFAMRPSDALGSPGGQGNHRASGPRSHEVTRPYVKRASVFSNTFEVLPRLGDFLIFFCSVVWIVDVLFVFLNPCDVFYSDFLKQMPTFLSLF